MMTTGVFALFLLPLGLGKEIAALEQKKSRQDAEALRKAQKEEIDKAIQQLLDDGMSVEDILSKITS